MSWVLVAAAWAGWSTAVAAVLVLRRRNALVADAEHELRGAAAAMGIAAEASRDGSLASPLIRLQVDRMTAALADLARARGARPAGAPELDAGRLAQVLANVSANAAEHGVGPVEVSGERQGRVVRLEVSNASGPEAVRESGWEAVRERAEGKREGRGRGLGIAKRAARELGGRVRLERSGSVTRVVIELPAGSGRDDAEAGRDDQPRAA
jgi:signal transduction histidine kinase